MATMAQPDRHALIRSGLEMLLPHLKVFVHTNLQRTYGAGYRDRPEFAGHRKSLEFDPRFLIKTAIAHWETAFRDSEKKIRNHLHLIREIANRWAHHGAIDDREARHAVETMQLLAIAIGGERAGAPFDELLAQFQSTPPPWAPSKELNGARLCPACKVHQFKRWPWGWDAHAAFKCKGLSETEPERRKQEFRDKYLR